MIVVLSGEGPSDLGHCSNGQGQCGIPEFVSGPMTLLVDKEIKDQLSYSVLESTPDCYHYLSKTHLGELDAARKQNGRSVSLTGKKRDQETGYFYVNAWMLGQAALALETQENDCAIAVLFRDCDGTRSAARGLWNAKQQSMQAGFVRAGLGERGVPMIPKPKSEAWLLCAIRDSYQHCARLEELSGNDDSPNNAKNQLEAAMNGKASAAEQRDWLEANGFDHAAVARQMPSYQAFKHSMQAALADCR
ncbi:hypothetical protein LH452_12735 [Laribacter hongkongensis]|uniref:hypothetical protein n=1 Tax=Laribacter hongkongensis TaxID=168471 RepID=UPI001EFC358E|nr:hypothetical protein [Laribacter hongkongensis]MCG9059781.1 hypothetical protein [Laribacter hongkongensis]MCG9084048.1 hypothetical protein [Laribacter hongkongensis]MCG9086521.1 hypothetical protein [Laribacter hongkongensis]